MSLVQDIKARISGGIVDLKDRVEEAADLAALVAARELPQRSPWCFVLKLGFDGGAADAAAGMFRQAISTVIGVVLVVRALDDVKSRKALVTIDALETALINLICGWAPAGAIGNFRALRGRLVSVANGLVIYQIDFALSDQLRIT